MAGTAGSGQGDSHPGTHGRESGRGSRSPLRGPGGSTRQPSVPLCPAVPPTGSGSGSRPPRAVRAQPGSDPGPRPELSGHTCPGRPDPRERGERRRSPDRVVSSFIEATRTRGGRSPPPRPGSRRRPAVTQGSGFCPSGTRSWRSGTWTSSSAGLRGDTQHCPALATPRPPVLLQAPPPRAPSPQAPLTQPLDHGLQHLVLLLLPETGRASCQPHT